MYVHHHIHPFNLKFSVYGLVYRTYIHVHATCSAVTLVWGSLRLAPIIACAYNFMEAHLVSIQLLQMAQELNRLNGTVYVGQWT